MRRTDAWCVEDVFLGLKKFAKDLKWNERPENRLESDSKAKEHVTD